MSQDEENIHEHDLHAYVDQQLSEDKNNLVESHLAKHPESADRVQEYTQLNEKLREIFSHQDQNNQTVVVRRQVSRILILSLVALSLIMFTGGFFLGRFSGHDTIVITGLADLPKRAIHAHMVYVPEIRHPVEVSAKQEIHMVKWLSKRLGSAIKAPNLRQHGYELIGGRLLPDGGKPAAQFLYENDEGERITLYIRKNEDPTKPFTSFKFQKFDDLGVFYWIDAPLGYALTAEIGKEKLYHIALSIYKFINP